MKGCDCLSYCGDDPDVAAGKCRPCRPARIAMAERLPKATQVGRMSANSRTITVTFETPLTDAQMKALARKVGIQQ